LRGKAGRDGVKEAVLKLKEMRKRSEFDDG
jgi:hypothetical protein